MPAPIVRSIRALGRFFLIRPQISESAFQMDHIDGVADGREGCDSHHNPTNPDTPPG
jgi:hypothetical protein